MPRCIHAAKLREAVARQEFEERARKIEEDARASQWERSADRGFPGVDIDAVHERFPNHVLYAHFVGGL